MNILRKPSLTAAADRLTAARDMHQTLAPIRNLITTSDEELRAAAIEAKAAGMTERAIAAHCGVSQPTIREWVDARHTPPFPAPGLATRVWTLHRIVLTASGLVAQLAGAPLPTKFLGRTVGDGRCVNGPKSADAARGHLTQAADALADIAGAVEATDRGIHG